MSDNPIEPQPTDPQSEALQAAHAPARRERNPVVTTLYWLLFIITAGGLLLSTTCTLAIVLGSGGGGEIQIGAEAFIIGGPFMLVFGGLAYWFWRLARRQAPTGK
jgi:hypothetical protein